MALYEKLGLGGEKHPLVLDIGHAYSKVGYGGELGPRATIRTIWDQNKPDSHILTSNEDTPKKSELVEKLTKFFDHVFFKVLQISPKDKWVIIAESLMSTSIFREAIAESLLCFYDCSSVLFAPDHLLVCFTSGTMNAVVIDSSYFETSVVPIIYNTPILWAWQSSNNGTIEINKNICDSLTKDARIKEDTNTMKKIDFDIPNKMIEDIKVKACFVAPFNRANDILEFREFEKERFGSPVDFDYILNDKTILVPGYIREESAEILFERNNDRDSVPYMVLDSILSCPIDCRKTLAGNIIASGGNTVLPGFKHRLLFELEFIVRNEEKYNILSDCEFRTHESPVSPNITAWLGGSILASMDTYSKKTITKDYYLSNNKRLPDWCVLDLKFPELSIERPLTLLSGTAKKYSQFSSKIGRRTIGVTPSLKSNTGSKPK